MTLVNWGYGRNKHGVVVSHIFPQISLPQVVLHVILHFEKSLVQRGEE
jgi:hypothetical protein